MNEYTKKNIDTLWQGLNKLNLILGREENHIDEYSCALLNVSATIEAIEQKPTAKTIAESIHELSHEDLTALSHLMWVRKNEIEKERRAYLEGK